MTHERRAAVIVTDSHRFTHIKKAAMKVANGGYYPTDSPVEIKVIVTYMKEPPVWLLGHLIDVIRIINDAFIVDGKQIVGLSIKAQRGAKHRTVVSCTELEWREVAS